MDAIWLDNFLRHALEEDIGGGDITTESCVPAGRRIQGRFLVKESGILCGLGVVRRVFLLLDPGIVLRIDHLDGEPVEAGDVAATLEGSARSILTGERTALNLLQRLSGVATAAARAVAAVKGFPVQITDTRKTTPGMRALEKYAVRTGGGVNHRFNLSDGVLIKDNHITAAGGIGPAVAAARARASHMLKIEVEVSSLDEVQEALDAGADCIMLDNMTDDDMRAAVRHIGGRALVEASGGMGARDLAQVAATGVDLISVGALTHSPRALDISLKF
ncbi:MAG: carboxylating nicotinate-nucleotide diphosphorylase [Oscillospiraceae bacterium]|jgi:nicotinate-nucleotide pyrophosphorylase (carboxylating)|nr:carboxylating nicotinate-nucleotide diphosphorylase [Oscillospiraceae bacterium]